ncbi:MarR family transcriptional regulator [Listeria floridensis FSL S10-1187]|uniref:MarR family transcriptional regulator n=1 Tax=Listeria floridensis FSL S10-1187 TaxID=1265817 RepID=A0ABN0RGF5_9LIST|nr:MarR family transcriptional regulator [Listeria floridensis]EUJ32856.1 MarR family transcriptional regulator [Listeria floridensis FSL S10-1187]
MDEKLVREVILSFREVSKKTHQFLSEEADKKNITSTQLMALSALKREPHLTLGELAERLKLSKSTTSGIVDRLVKAGFLMRSRVELNRRALNLELTELGEQKASETYDLFFERLSPILSIGKEELMSMLNTHRKIIELLERGIK